MRNFLPIRIIIYVKKRVKFYFYPGYERQDGFGDNFGLSQANMMKAELMAAVERLGDLLPPNTLDQLIDELGGPEYVAEVRIICQNERFVRQKRE